MGTLLCPGGRLWHPLGDDEVSWVSRDQRRGWRKTEPVSGSFRPVESSFQGRWGLSFAQVSPCAGEHTRGGTVRPGWLGEGLRRAEA